jgi:hypothetical protein
MHNERTIALITSHKNRMARALARQVRSLSPNYATVDQSALEASFARMLGYVVQFLQSGDDNTLKEYAAHTAQLRSAVGFRADDFMLAALAFLPVVRRFLVENARDVATGLAAYESFEAVAIPLLAETGTLFRHATAKLSDFEDDDITQPSAPKARRNRFVVESVVGDESEELTPFT